MKKSILLSILIGALLVTVSQGIARKNKKDREWSHKTIFEKITTEEKIEVSIEMSLVDLTLAKTTDNLAFKTDITYDARFFEPLVSYNVRGDYGLLELGMEYDEDFENAGEIEDLIKGVTKYKNKDGDKNQWELLLTDRIPMEISAEIAMGTGEINLSGLKIKDFRIETGLSKISVSFDEPNPVKMDRLAVEAGLGDFKIKNLGNASAERVSVEVGLGSAVIDLGGQISKNLIIDMDVGLGSLEIRIPKGTPVKIHCGCSFLSSVDFEEFTKKGEDTYLSPGFDEKKDYVTLNLNVGLGSAKVAWIE